MLGRLAGHREVRLERDAARLDLARQAAQQLAHARIDERAGCFDVGRGDERIDHLRTELRLDFLVDLRAQARLDVRAQLGERVELADAPAPSSSSSSGSLFSLISLTVTVTVCRGTPSASSNSMSFVSPASCPTTFDSISSTTAPRPSSTT